MGIYPFEFFGVTEIPSPTSVYSSQEGGHPDDDSQLRQWSSLIGIITAIVGNILISFALNTQRYAHIRIEREHAESHPLSTKASRQTSATRRNYGAIVQENIAEERARLNTSAPGPGGPRSEENDERADEMDPLKSSFQSDDTLTTSEGDTDEHDGRKSYLKSGYWWVGIFLMTVGETGNFLAYGFAPASVVSPLGVVALISNCLIAPFMLKERFRQRDFWGVAVAIAGAVTVVWSANSTETKMGPDDLWLAIKRWEFLVYLGIAAAAIIALMFASPKYGSRTVLIDLGLVGLFGGFTALSTKGVSSLLSDTLWRTFTFPITYLLVFILITSALMQIRYINRALQNFDSTVVIPTQFVMFTISVIVGSAVLYRDFESTTIIRTGKFVGGCLLTFFGVYLITSGRPLNEDCKADENPTDEEQPIALIDEEAEDQDTMANGHHKEPPKISSQLIPSDEGVVGSGQLGSRSSTYQPSISITAESLPSAISSDAIEDHNPWAFPDETLGTNNHDARTPLGRSFSDTPQTPTMNRIQSDVETPFFTPATTVRARPEPPTALRNTPSGPEDPQTPTKASKSAGPPKADDSRLTATPIRSARNSISRLTPAPFLTPLSSSLSVVVADSLRRGEGVSKRAKSGRNSTSQSQRQSLIDTGRGEELSRHNTRETDSQTDIADIIGSEGSVSKKKSRLKGMSDAIGTLVSKRGRRKKGDEEDSGTGSPAGSAEAGPST